MSRSLGLLAGCALVALGGWIAAAPAAGDRVVLANGEVFDGVVAEATDGAVRIRLAYGEITLAAADVVTVERRTTPLALYLARAASLDETSGARAWLELAAWARERGLVHAARDAVLHAAAADPELPELAPWMRRLGYSLEGRPPRWVPFREAPLREVAAPPLREPGVAGGDDSGGGVEQRLARAVELLAEAGLERERAAAREASSAPSARPVAMPYLPVVVGGGWILPSPAPDDPPPFRLRSDGVVEQLLRRQPGSLLPVGRPPSEVIVGRR